MTKRDIISIAITILGVRFIFYAILNMIGLSRVFAPSLSFHELDFLQLAHALLPAILLTALSSAIDIFLGLFVLLKAENISSYILKKDSEIKIQSVTGNEAQIIAITLLLIGLYFSFKSIVEIAKITILYFAFPEIGRGNSELFRPIMSIGLAISLIFGLALSFNAKRTANWFCGIDARNEATVDE